MSGSNRSSDRSRRPARSRGIGWARVLPLAACLGAAGWTTGGCATTPAKPVDGLELVVSTEGLSAPQDFDDINLDVYDQADGGAWNKIWGNDYMLPSQHVTLPATFTLFAGQSPDEVLIAVTAIQGGQGGTPVVQRVAQVQVPTDRLALLYLVLAQACEGQVAVAGDAGEPMSTCASGESCQPSTGACGSNIIPPSALPTYTPGQNLDVVPDGGLGSVVASIPPGSGSSATSISASSSSGLGVTSTSTSTGSSTSSTSASSSSGPEGTSTSMSASTSGAGGTSTSMSTASSTSGSSGCTDACTAGLTECTSGGVQTCQTQASGCAQWVTTATCGTHETCAVTGGTAACSCNSTLCTAVGEICQDAQTVAACAKDANNCLYVASTTTCASPESCGIANAGAGAACSLICSNTCTVGEKTCVSGELATCTLGSNGCLAYGTPVACGAHQGCTGAAGMAACTCNTSTGCSSAGTTCSNTTTLVTCAKDAQDCVYESSTSTCGTHQSCTGTAGTAACTCNKDPVCSAAGNTCASTTTLATCTKDSQNCVYDSLNTTCGDGACSAGACCTNSCTNGQTSCVSGSLATCVLGSKGCWAFGTPVACSSGNVCYEGSCVPCTPGATQCNGAVPQTCGSAEQWVSGSVTAGMCNAICTPGASPPPCNGAMPCSSNGQWGAVTVGQCDAVCTPGATECNGVNGLTLQTCTSSGTWGTGVVVAGQCGACSPVGATQCSGALLQTCTSAGTWSTALAAQGVCGATCSAGAVLGCADGYDESDCGLNGQPETNACGVICTPSEAACDEGDPSCMCNQQCPCSSGSCTCYGVTYQ